MGLDFRLLAHHTRLPLTSTAEAAMGAPPNPSGRDLETTVSLLNLIRQGDESASDRLLKRHLPVLTRWARGRLPRSARDLADTNDLVQDTLVRAMKHLDTFEVRHEGAFLAYLRRILINLIH